MPEHPVNTNGVDKVTQSEVQKQNGSRVFRWSLILTAGLAALVILGLFISVAMTDIKAVDHGLHVARPWLAAWRLLVFLLLIGGWNLWSRLCASWTGMDQGQLKRMLDYRWRLALWLLVMEAVLSQAVLSDFVHHLVSLGTG